MASVPSAGCLLAKNQYYRSECSGGLGAACHPQTHPPFFSPSSILSQYLIMWSFPPLAGLPDLIDKYWWIKSFFHSEPSPPPVGRKTLSAS
ncbi:Pancreatic progenitor cell differentiation and proliferation factor-like, partial [Manacus vitellinus]